jgi:hypothetical protein
MKAVLFVIALLATPVAAWAVCPAIDPACASPSRSIGSPYEPNGLKPPPGAPNALGSALATPSTAPGLYRPPSYQSQAVARPYAPVNTPLQAIHPVPGSVNDPAGVSAPAGERLYAPPQN